MLSSDAAQAIDMAEIRCFNEISTHNATEAVKFKSLVRRECGV